MQSKVRQDLATKAGVDLQEVSLNSVSATWGSEITDKAIRALIVFFIVIALYITIRFEWKMAVGAVWRPSSTTCSSASACTRSSGSRSRRRR